MTNPKCIVCGKPIPKVTSTVYLRETTSQHFHGEAGNVTSYSKTVFVDKDKWPKTREECAAFSNGIVVSVSRSRYDEEKRIDSFGVWDGESYENEFFHSQSCAVLQGYAAARAGHRWVWK